MSGADLRPCKCGGAALVEYVQLRDIWQVRCSLCPTFVWDTTEQGARDKWNRAAEQEPLTEQELDEMLEVIASAPSLSPRIESDATRLVSEVRRLRALAVQFERDGHTFAMEATCQSTKEGAARLEGAAQALLGAAKYIRGKP